MILAIALVPVIPPPDDPRGTWVYVGTASVTFDWRATAAACGPVPPMLNAWILVTDP